MSILKNKTYKKSQKLSRYSAFPIYYHSLDNKYILGTTSWLSENTKFTNYKIQRGDTLDLISLLYYSSAAYYWVIADFNRILDPYEELKEGSIIKIPVLSNIQYEDF